VARLVAGCLTINVGTQLCPNILLSDTHGRHFSKKRHQNEPHYRGRALKTTQSTANPKPTKLYRQTGNGFGFLRNANRKHGNVPKPILIVNAVISNSADLRPYSRPLRGLCSSLFDTIVLIVYEYHAIYRRKSTWACRCRLPDRTGPREHAPENRSCRPQS